MQTGAPYRAVLFDALGTLIELEPPWPMLRTVLRARHGIELEEDEAREAMLAEMAYYRAHHLEGREQASLEKLRLRCAEVLRERLPAAAALSLEETREALLDSLRFTPYPDAAPTLVALREAGLLLAVVSNWDCSLHSVLAEVGIAGAVDSVVVSAEVGAAKPDPAIFESALETLRRPAATALFVGDSLDTDVAGATAAGLRALLLDRQAAVAGRERERGDVEKVFSLADLPSLVLAPASP